MLKMTLKEILIQKKVIVFSIIYGLVFTFVLCRVNDSSASFYINTFIPAAITYTLIMSSCGKDDKNKVDIVLNSLPITRRDIVLSKYISSIVFLIISVLISVISSLILNFTGIAHVRDCFNISYIGISIVATALLCSIYFPVFFKVGYLKSKYFQVVLIMALLFIPLYLSESIQKHHLPQLINNFLSQAQIMLNIEAIVFALLISVISIMISSFIYNNRDF